MSASERLIELDALALRQEFDRTFAEPAGAERASYEEFISLRAGADVFALRALDISGIYAGKKITPIPSHVGALLGVAAFRGSVLPVYDLRAFLNQRDTDAPGWIAIASGAPVALAFNKFNGYFRVERGAAHEEKMDASRSREHVLGLIQTGDVVRAVLDVRSIVSAIEKMSSERNQREEQ